MKHVLKKTSFVTFGLGAWLCCLLCFFPTGQVLGEEQPATEPMVKAESETLPVIRGQRCAVKISINNPTGDVIIIDSIYTDRGADESIKCLQSQYGRVFRDESGRIIYDNMAQIASRDVFFHSGAAVPPGGEGAFVINTRFFRRPRNITVTYYRIPAGSVGDYIYKPQKDTAFDRISYLPLTNIHELENSTDIFIFWNGSHLLRGQTDVSIEPRLNEPRFSLKAAGEMLPRNLFIREVSFSDTFGAWIFQADASTWLVTEKGAEQLGGIESLVFEKIDSTGGQKITFRVPKEIFENKFTLEQGDGMYRVGTFLSVSGPEILDVFRILRENGVSCRVYYYFFSSYFIDTGKP
jgi:hypothetical protein